MTKNDSRFRNVFGIKMNVKLNNKLYENDNLKKSKTFALILASY